MLVKMLSTRKGAPDNINVQTYFEGHPYEIHGELLDVFLKEGWCEAAEPFRAGENEGDAAPTGGESTGESQEGGAVEGDQPEGESGEGTKEPELVLAEADVLAKYTLDELLDLAEEQGIEVPADVVQKAAVVAFLAGKLKVTVEQE